MTIRRTEEYQILPVVKPTYKVNFCFSSISPIKEQIKVALLFVHAVVIQPNNCNVGLMYVIEVPFFPCKFT